MKFIPDSEINLLETGDLLGTKPYSELLYDIVTECSTPFNIGLLGGWGTGKSTIIKTLKNILISKGKQIEVFTYDAWKYSKDSFRRTFIMELNNFLKYKPSEELKEILYCDTTDEKEGEVKISKKGILRVLALSPLLLFLFLISKQLGTDLKVVIAFLSVFQCGMIFIISQLIISYKISISKSKIFSPEQFSDIFKEIVQVSLSKKKSDLKWIEKSKDSIDDIKKLIIVIDNVDRCDNETVIKALQLGFDTKRNYFFL